MATLPSPHTFTAGEVVTAANLNSIGATPDNFLLGLGTNQKPRAILRSTVAQSLTSGAAASLALDTEDLDSDNAHSTVTNTSRFTVVTPGLYRFSGVAQFAANATGKRLLQWAKNGTLITNAVSTMLNLGAGDIAWLAAPTILVQLAVNDFVELQALQNSGGALNATSASVYVEFVSA